MANKRDYYEVLGVSKNASDAEIKSAYKKMAIKYHPDRQQDKSEEEKTAAEEKFKEAAEAYDVLRDPNKRQQYDQYGFNGPQFGGGGFSGASNMSMDDIFSMFGDIFGGHGAGSPFDSFFGGGHSGRGGRPQFKGGDLRINVRLTLNEVLTGVTKKFKVKKNVVCPECHGTGSQDGKTETCGQCKGSGVVYRTMRTMLGAMQTQTTCPGCGGTGSIIKNRCGRCGGEGIVSGEEVVEVKIPAGIDNGMVVNVPGKGHMGKLNGVPGDIQVIVTVEENKTFVRNGNDLYYQLQLDIPTAILGGSVEIPTLEGKVKIKIEPGTQPGKVMRIRGKGLPALQGFGYGTGDIIVTTNVYIPQKLSTEEKEIFEKLKGNEHMKPSDGSKETFFSKFKKQFE